MEAGLITSGLLRGLTEADGRIDDDDDELLFEVANLLLGSLIMTEEGDWPRLA